MGSGSPRSPAAILNALNNEGETTAMDGEKGDVKGDGDDDEEDDKGNAFPIFPYTLNTFNCNIRRLYLSD